MESFVLGFSTAASAYAFGLTVYRTWQSRPCNARVASASALLACSLEVRAVQVRTGCCLLQSKKGKALSGAAIDARIAKLVKMGVLFASRVSGLESLARKLSLDRVQPLAVVKVGLGKELTRKSRWTA